MVSRSAAIYRIRYQQNLGMCSLPSRLTTTVTKIAKAYLVGIYALTRHPCRIRGALCK